LRIIEGRNPVIEALRSDADIDTILINKDAAQGSLNKIIELAKEKNILVKNVDKALLDSLSWYLKMNT
jgi:23S rRNA (guanosine2251-2'-O)-methyltransferase